MKSINPFKLLAYFSILAIVFIGSSTRTFASATPGESSLASPLCGGWSIVSSPSPGGSDNSLLGVAAVPASFSHSGGTEAGGQVMTGNQERKTAGRVFSSDMWAVGYAFSGNSGQSLIENWNGTSWSVVKSPNVGTIWNELFGVATVSASNVWAVGDYVNTSGFDQTLIEHWNGTQWSIVPSPNDGPQDNLLHSIVAVSANNIWAVGESNYFSYLSGKTLIEHWDGTKWSIVKSPNVGSYTNYLDSVATVSAHNIWAVGLYTNKSQIGQTLIEHWNGTKWSIIASPDAGSGFNSLQGVAALSSTDVWAVGDYLNPSYPSLTLTEHWNGSRWNIIPSPSPGGSENPLTGVAIVSASNIWAAGYYDSGRPYQTLTEQKIGTNWSVISSPNVGAGDNQLYSIAAISAHNIWAVGSYLDSNQNSHTLTEFYC